MRIDDLGDKKTLSDLMPIIGKYVALIFAFLSVYFFFFKILFF